MYYFYVACVHSACVKVYDILISTKKNSGVNPFVPRLAHGFFFLTCSYSQMSFFQQPVLMFDFLCIFALPLRTLHNIC